MKRTYLVTLDQPVSDTDDGVAREIEAILQDEFDSVTVKPWAHHGEGVTGANPFASLEQLTKLQH